MKGFIVALMAFMLVNVAYASGDSLLFVNGKTILKKSTGEQYGSNGISFEYATNQFDSVGGVKLRNQSGILIYDGRVDSLKFVGATTEAQKLTKLKGVLASGAVSISSMDGGTSVSHSRLTSAGSVTVAANTAYRVIVSGSSDAVYTVSVNGGGAITYSHTSGDRYPGIEGVNFSKINVSLVFTYVSGGSLTVHTSAPSP